MRRVITSSFTLALATLMIGLVVSQARADQVGYTADPAMFSSGGMALTTRQALPAYAVSAVDFSRSVSATTNGSFSIGSPALNVTKTAPLQPDKYEGSDGPRVAVPEPATMLLLGTGLVGAAAIVRKRLKLKK